MENILKKLELLISQVSEQEKAELLALLEILLQNNSENTLFQLKTGWAVDQNTQEKHGSIFIRLIHEVLEEK